MFTFFLFVYMVYSIFFFVKEVIEFSSWISVVIPIYIPICLYFVKNKNLEDKCWETSSVVPYRNIIHGRNFSIYIGVRSSKKCIVRRYVVWKIFGSLLVKIAGTIFLVLSTSVFKICRLCNSYLVFLSIAVLLISPFSPSSSPFLLTIIEENELRLDSNILLKCQIRKKNW